MCISSIQMVQRTTLTSMLLLSVSSIYMQGHLSAYQVHKN